MDKAFILVFAFALAGVGTNAESVSGAQAYTPLQVETPALCKSPYGVEAYGVEIMQELVTMFHQEQWSPITSFSCRLVRRVFCELADGVVITNPTEECMNPRDQKKQLIPFMDPRMFDHPRIGAHGSAIQPYTKKMDNLNDFHLNQAPTIIFIGDKKVRVFIAVSDIYFEQCHKVRSLVYVNYKGAPMPGHAVMLEVHEGGMCMSKKAVSTIVNEAFTPGAPLDLYMNNYEHDRCFGPHIKKFLESIPIHDFVRMSKSANSNPTSLVGPWVEALNSFSLISENNDNSIVLDVVKAVIENAAKESGVCVDPRMNKKEMDRLKWMIESDPDRWGEDFFEHLTFFLCGTEGIDVYRFNDPVSKLEKVQVVLEASRENWVKIMFECEKFFGVWKSSVNYVQTCVNYVQPWVNYVADQMYTLFPSIISALCENLFTVALVVVPASVTSVICWLVRKANTGGRRCVHAALRRLWPWSTFDKKKRNSVRKRQSSSPSFKELLTDVRQKFAACCSCLKPTKTTKTEARFEHWDPWKKR